MARAGYVGVVVGAALAGCLPSPATTCDDGSLCPAGTVCLADGGCALPAAIAACDGVAEGATCSFPGTPDGVCAAGVCSVPRCGNGRLEFGEQCDDGNTDFGDGCSPRCDSDEACGNGVTDALVGEDCDCGTNPDALPPGCPMINSDAEGSICRPSCAAVGCGDGVVVLPEDCEGADLGGRTCLDLGYYGGDLACRASCRFDVTACAGRCGDGVLDPVEICDTTSTEACSAYGLALGRPGCNAACGVDTSTCGRLDWRRVYTTEGHGVGATFVDELDQVYFGDANPRVLRWTGGAVLDELATPLNASYVAGSSSTDLWISDGAAVARSADGVAWTVVRPLTPFEYVSALTVRGPDDVVIAGNVYGTGGSDGGFVDHWDGAAWTRVLADLPTWTTAVAACPDGRLVAGGQGGQLTTWTAATVTEEQPFGTSATIVSLHCRADDLLVMALDTGDVVVRGLDGLDDVQPLGLGPTALLDVGDGQTALAGEFDSALFDGRSWRIIDAGPTGSSAAGVWRDGAGYTYLLRSDGIYRADNYVEANPGGNRSGRVATTPTEVWTADGGQIRRNGRRIHTGCDVPTGIQATPTGAFVACLHEALACTPAGCVDLGAPFDLGLATRLPSGDILGFTLTVIDNAFVIGGVRYHAGAWSTVDVPPGLSVPRAIAPTDASAAWATTDTGVVRFDGTAWSTTDAPAGSYFGLLVRADDDVWAASDDGLVAHFDGATWTSTTIPSSATATSLTDAGPAGIMATNSVFADPAQLWQHDAAGWIVADTTAYAGGLGELATDVTGDVWFGSAARLHLRPR